VPGGASVNDARQPCQGPVGAYRSHGSAQQAPVPPQLRMVPSCRLSQPATGPAENLVIFAIGPQACFSMWGMTKQQAPQGRAMNSPVAASSEHTGAAGDPVSSAHNSSRHAIQNPTLPPPARISSQPTEIPLFSGAHHVPPAMAKLRSLTANPGATRCTALTRSAAAAALAQITAGRRIRLRTRERCISVWTRSWLVAGLRQ
jgi:hypothetical protein